MKKENPKGITMTGSFRRAGVTFYMRNGQVVARVSHSDEKRSCTMPQFVQRMRMRHTIALWQMLGGCNPMFTARKTPYLGFASLANRLPAVFVPKNGPLSDASLLMPEIPVSDGTLPTVKQWLGEYNGTPALFTELKASDMGRGRIMRLYSAKQNTEGSPRVRFDVRDVRPNEFVSTPEGLALVGEEFADEMKGWALVRVEGEQCSSQALLTRCTYYQRFTTDEALRAAAHSYGGLTD